MNVHNPDQYMTDFRHIIAQGKKRIGIIIGAGAPAGIKASDNNGPLIPTVKDLTKTVVEKAKKDGYLAPLESLITELSPDPNIEAILSHIRSLASVIGKTKVHGLDSNGFTELGSSICMEIGKIVNQELPEDESAYAQLVSWIAGTDREYPVEVFTTNYDLLLEQALERSKTPYFDGFTGANEPFFDSSSVASNDLPPRWARVWKLHGSLGWSQNKRGDVIRSGDRSAAHLVFPEHLKYDQTQKAPYVALFDRLRDFLMTPDTLLIATGFSFADAHIAARIDECLSANPTASVFAFQFNKLSKECCACDIASRRSNMSVFSPDRALINGIDAPWQLGDQPTPNWKPVRDTYWSVTADDSNGEFKLGKFDQLVVFFAAAKSSQYSPPNLTAETETER